MTQPPPTTPAPSQASATQPPPQQIPSTLALACDIYAAAEQYHQLHAPQNNSKQETAIVVVILIVTFLTFAATRSFANALFAEVTAILLIFVWLFRSLLNPLVYARDISQRHQLKPHPSAYQVAYELHQQRPPSWTEQLGESGMTRFIILIALLLALSLTPTLGPELLGTNELTKPFANFWTNIQQKLLPWLPYAYVLVAYGAGLLVVKCYTDMLRRKNIGAILLALKLTLTGDEPR